MRAKSGALILMVAAVALAALLLAQRRGVAALRVELGRQRAAAPAFEDLPREPERLLAAPPAAGQPGQPADVQEALRLARAEVENLQRQAEEAAARTQPAERFVRGQTIPAAEWKNAGTATPAAALETALWAGAGGDVTEFARLITLLDPRAQKAAQALLDGLPEAVRGEYGTSERLIAFLSVKDIPLGSAAVRQSNDLQGWPMGAAHQMQVVLTQADGTQKATSLILLNRGDGWKLAVTDATVAKYAAQLNNAAGPAPGK